MGKTLNVQSVYSGFVISRSSSCSPSIYLVFNLLELFGGNFKSFMAEDLDISGLLSTDQNDSDEEHLTAAEVLKKLEEVRFFNSGSNCRSFQF